MSVDKDLLYQRIWPSNKSSFTTRVYRSKTDLEERFIGGAQWKYHVIVGNFYPVVQILNLVSDSEEDKESIGDEADVTNRDVAATFRMDILTHQGLWMAWRGGKGGWLVVMGCGTSLRK